MTTDYSSSADFRRVGVVRRQRIRPMLGIETCVEDWWFGYPAVVPKSYHHE
jgi:hypothetical protein